VRVTLPSLRRHLDDLPDLVDLLLEQAGATEEAAGHLRSAEFLARMRMSAWPGNVRELFNHVDRCLLMQAPLPPQELLKTREMRVDPHRSYAEGRRLAVEQFERSYVEALLKANGGKISEAARAAGMDRNYLHRLIRRHGLRG
jgi:two-component system response regulator GlrR